MPSFDDALGAWSLYSAALERLIGQDVGAAVVLPFHTWPALTWSEGNDLISAYNKQTFTDIIPQIDPDPARYLESSARVSTGFETYVRGLNGAVLNAQPTADRQKLMNLYREWQTKQRELTGFEFRVLDAWKAYQKASGSQQTESRADWERRYRYDTEREMLRRRVDEISGAYLAEVSSNPQLIRLANASAALSSENSMLALPAEEWQIPYRETWESRLRSGVIGNIKQFVGSADGDYKILASVTSASSRIYEKTWAAKVKGRYGFFRASGSASGGEFEKNTSSSIQSVEFSFKNYSTFSIARGRWFDGNLIREFGSKVDFDQYWGNIGTLNAIPLSVVLAHSPSAIIKMEENQRNEYKKWRSISGGAGFGKRFGWGI